MTADMQQTTGPENGNKGRSKILHWILSVAILIGLAIAVGKYVHSGDVLAALDRFYWHYIPPIVVLSAVYLLLKALWFGIALQPLSGAHMGSVMRAYVAGQPATLIPGGLTARAGLLAEAGVPVSTSSAPILLNSVLDQVSFILLALLAAVFFDQARVPALIATGVLVLIIVLMSFGVTRRAVGHPFRLLMRKLHGEHHWDNFTESLGRLATPSILGSGILLTVAGKFILVMILDLSMLGEGIQIAYAPLLLATALPTLLGRFTPLPGGVGPTEIGMVAILASVTTAELAVLTAGVAIYRVGTIVLQALMGAVVYWFFWKPQREQTATREYPQMVDSGHPGRVSAGGSA